MTNPFRVATKQIQRTGEAKSLFTTSSLPSGWSWVGDRGRGYGEWKLDRSVKDGYLASAWVYAAITAIAKAASSVPWEAVRIATNGKVTLLPGNPLETIIREPNPFMTGQDMIERMTQHLFLGGNAIWRKNRVKGLTVELWPIMDLDHIQPIPDRRKFVKEYRYTPSTVSENETLQVRDVIHIMFMHPSDPYWGMAPLQAVARTVDTDVEAVKWNMTAMSNRAVTDGVFTVPQVINEEQWTQFRKQVREQHQGAVYAREPWVLGGGAKWEQMSMSPAEMDFIESRKLSQEEILSVFGVSPPIIGIYENATLANLEASHKMFWENTIVPLLDNLQSAFNLTLAPEFGTDVKIRYNTSNVDALHDNFQTKISTGQIMFKMGIPVEIINQILELGIPKYTGWDVSYLPAGMVRIDEDQLIPLKQTVTQVPTTPAELPTASTPQSLNDGKTSKEPASLTETVPTKSASVVARERIASLIALNGHTKEN